MTTKKSNGRRGRKSQYLIDAPKFGHEVMREALFNVQDSLERAQLQFVLLDELAEQIANREDPLLEASEVSIGIRITDFTESGSSMFRSLVPDAGWKDFVHGQEINNLSYTSGSVPVVIWFIHNDLDVFKYPDVRFYYQTEFRIPNPFKEYWKIRNLIK